MRMQETYPIAAYDPLVHTLLKVPGIGLKTVSHLRILRRRVVVRMSSNSYQRQSCAASDLLGSRKLVEVSRKARRRLATLSESMRRLVEVYRGGTGVRDRALVWRRHHGRGGQQSWDTTLPPLNALVAARIGVRKGQALRSFLLRCK